MIKGMRQQVGWANMTPVVVMVALALVGVGTWFYMARPAPLPAGEVRELLADRTAAGAWPNGQPYMIWFGPEGGSLHGGPGRPTAAGHWRVVEDGRVCFALEAQGETCFGVAREAGETVWILAGSGRTYPFALREGRDPAL